MKKPSHPKSSASMLPEYDFSQGIRGKYAKRYAEGTNLVLLDEDVARLFPDSESVNRTLRTLAGIVPKRSSRKTRKT
ncbi:MAG: hypothetical protein ACRD1I_08155 [Terriglobia bacterium]